MADETAAVERPALNVDVQDAGPARKLLKIEIPEERIKDKTEEAFGTLRSDAAVPGFRRGRAPRRLLEKKFGKALRDDVKNQLLSEAYTQACEDNDLDVVGEPDVKDIENIDLPESGSLSFEVEVEVTPEVALPDFSTLEVKKPKLEATDEDVQKEVERYQERFGKTAEAPEATIEAGDFVQANAHVFAGESAGSEEEALAHGHGTYIFVPGEQREFKGHVLGIVVADLGKQLIGKKAGDTVEIKTTGPKGHENEQIRDQPILIQIELTKVERLEPADMDTVVKALGVESEDDLRTRLKEMLQNQKQAEQQTAMHRQVRDQLGEKVELELPEGLTGRQIERVLNRQRMEGIMQGKSEDEVDQEVAEAREESETEARKQLKMFFILDRAAKDLEIEVQENELNSRIAMVAMRQGRRPEKVRQEMSQRGELEQLFLQIREHKTLDKILEQAKVEEVDPSEVEETKQD